MGKNKRQFSSAQKHYEIVCSSNYSPSSTEGQQELTIPQLRAVCLKMWYPQVRGFTTAHFRIEEIPLIGM